MNNEIKFSTLTDIAKIYSPLTKTYFSPIQGNEKLLDMDESVKRLVERGGRKRDGGKNPHTPDILMFRGNELLPVELKWRNKVKPVTDGALKHQNRKMAKKLLTIVANTYLLNKIELREFGMVVSFYEKENISEQIRKMAKGFIRGTIGENKSEKIMHIIDNVKIKQLEFEEFTRVNLKEFTTVPKGFIDYYIL